MMNIETSKKKTRLAASIDGSENQRIAFKPTPEFYKAVGIGRKRFGQLYRGEKSPLLDEVHSIARYFGKPVHDFIDLSN